MNYIPFVINDVVNPEGIFNVVITLIFVFTQTRKNVDFIELMVDSGTLSKASRWNLSRITTPCTVSDSCHFTRIHIIGKKVVQILLTYFKEKCNKR